MSKEILSKTYVGDGVYAEFSPADGNVKSYPRIKWVNSMGGSAYEGCTPDIVKNGLAASGFKAAFLATRKSSGKPAPSAPNMAPVAKKNLPF